MNKQIDDELLDILNSDITVEQVKYLMKAKCLSKQEENLCECMLKSYALYGKFNLLQVMKEFKIDTNIYLDLKVYKRLEVYKVIDEFIYNRRMLENQQVLEAVLDGTARNTYNEKVIDLVLKRYRNQIVVKEDESFRELENPEDLEPNIEISSAIEYVDNLIGGLEDGLLTTIVGTNEEYKTMYAVNIAYRALQDEKNVLFISLGNSTKNIYKQFLCKHSCTPKFDRPISIQELNTKYDLNIYSSVYGDFENNHLNNLILFDNREFDVSTHYNLQRLIVHAQDTFIENTERGIDLIILDEFSNMKLDVRSKTITNTTTVVNEYYKYLKEQAKGLLGTKKEIPIVITACANDNGIMAVQNGWDFTLNCINQEMKILSDNIISIYGDKNLKTAQKIKVKVLKSMSNIMDVSKDISAIYENYHIKFNDMIEQTLEEVKEFNDFLNKQLDSSRQSYNALWNLHQNQTSNTNTVDEESLSKENQVITNEIKSKSLNELGFE